MHEDLALRMLAAGNFHGDTGTTRDDVYGALDQGGDYNLIGDGSQMYGISNGSNGNQVGTSSSPINAKLAAAAQKAGYSVDQMAAIMREYGLAGWLNLAGGCCGRRLKRGENWCRPGRRRGRRTRCPIRGRCRP